MPQQPTPLSDEATRLYELIQDMDRIELPLNFEDYRQLEEDGFKPVQAQVAFNELLNKGYLNQVKVYAIGWIPVAGRNRFNG